MFEEFFVSSSSTALSLILGTASFIVLHFGAKAQAQERIAPLKNYMDYITKKSEFDEVNFTVFFTATENVDPTGISGTDVYKFLKSFTSKNIFALSLSDRGYKMKFHGIDHKFDIAASWEDLNSRNGNIYYTFQEEYYPSGANPTFIINFKFKLLSMPPIPPTPPMPTSGILENSLRLSIGKLEYTRKAKQEIINEINPTQAKFKLNDGTVFNYKFKMKQRSSVLDTNSPMVYEFSQIE